VIPNSPFNLRHIIKTEARVHLAADVDEIEELSMITRPTAQGEARERYLSGNFAPVKVETTAFGLEVNGRIPEKLSRC
jgi:hypothetical protein